MNSYTVRKLADNNCWMVSNLKYELEANKTYVGSYNDGTTFEFNSGSDCSGTTNKDCVLNGNTAYDKSTKLWYYSWYAATAAVGKFTDANIDIDGSICPVGWKLPSNYTVNQKKSYGSITNAYGLTTNGANSFTNHNSIFIAFPLSFIYTGDYGNGKIANPNYYGEYWSSTVVTNNSQRGWYFQFGGPDGQSRYYTYPQHTYFKWSGLAVRCVAV